MMYSFKQSSSHMAVKPSCTVKCIMGEWQGHKKLCPTLRVKIHSHAIRGCFFYFMIFKTLYIFIILFKLCLIHIMSLVLFMHHTQNHLQVWKSVLEEHTTWASPVPNCQRKKTVSHLKNLNAASISQIFVCLWFLVFCENKNYLEAM